MELLGAFFLGAVASPILTGAALLAILVLTLFFEKEGWATLLVLLFGGGILYYSWNSISFVGLMMWVGVYVVVGMLYTIPQYISFSKKRSRRWKQFLNNWKVPDHLKHDYWVVDMALRKGIISDAYDSRAEKHRRYTELSADTTEKIEEAWQETCDEALAKDWDKSHSCGFLKVRISGQVTPKWEVYHDKTGLIAQMLLWMVYWPAYLILLVIDDLLTHLVEWMVEKLGGWFTRISNQHFNAA